MKSLLKFGIDLSHSHLLPIALTHTSYANEHNCISYERLEFLGDAVLELVSSDYIYKSRKLSEGEMSKKRSLYVCENALFEYAKELDLANYIKVGNSVRYPNKTVIADVFEAVIGVIYLELGIEVVTKFFNDLIVPYIERNVDFLNDYKSSLQELVQTDKKSVDYVLVKEEGPAHMKRFVINAVIDGIVYGTGSGSSKKDAEQMAAKEAINKCVGEE